MSGYPPALASAVAETIGAGMVTRKGPRELAEDALAVVWEQLGNDHYVIFTADGWTTTHSVDCRLSGRMHECPYHAAAELVAGPDLLGRWKITGIDREGLPEMERDALWTP
jgi:hypothetical protein